jgi:hypothetical protein
MERRILHPDAGGGGGGGGGYGGDARIGRQDGDETVTSRELSLTWAITHERE